MRLLKGSLLAPQGASWSLCPGARAKCAQPFPEHHPGWGPCSGAHLKQCTRLCRSRQLCQFVFRNSACWFSALQAHGAAIGGTFWPAWPTQSTLHQWAGPPAHQLLGVAVVPIFASNTAPAFNNGKLQCFISHTWVVCSSGTHLAQNCCVPVVFPCGSRVRP